MRIQRYEAVELLEYTAVSAGMMFGASCYWVIGVIAGTNSVPRICCAIIIAAALCITVALAVGEMASRFPSALAIRTYLKRAFGDEISLSFTYLSLLVIALFAGIEIKVFWDALWPGTSPHARALATVALLGVLAYLNVTGRELPRLVQVLICLALLVTTTAVSCVSVTRGSVSLADPPSGPQASLAATIGIAFFVFSGFEWVTPIAKSPEASRLRIPLSMIIAIVAVAITYILFAVALKLALPSTDLIQSRVPHLLLGGRLFPVYGHLFMQSLGVLALLTLLNAGIIGASRLLYVLSRDRSFFGWLNRRLAILNPRGVSPACVVLLCSLCLMSSLWEIYGDAPENVAQMSAGLYCLIYGALVASHARLRGSSIEPASFRSPLPVCVYYLLTAVLLLLGVGTFLGPSDQMLTRVALLAGIAFTSGAAATAVARSRRLAATRYP